MIVRSGSEVRDPATSIETIDDVVRAVAVVRVAIEDADAARTALLAQHARGHDEAVEGTEPARLRVAGVVEARARRARDAVMRDREARGGEQRARRVWQRRGDLRRAIAEAVIGQAREHALDIAAAVRQRELVDRDRRRLDDLDGQHALQRLDHEGGFDGARRERRRVGQHFGGIEDGCLHANRLGADCRPPLWR